MNKSGKKNTTGLEATNHEKCQTNNSASICNNGADEWLRTKKKLYTGSTV